MMINRICVEGEGYVSCKSGFYSALDIIDNYSSYSFSPGVIKLIGEIDSGNWAISYLMSMYIHRPGDFVLYEKPKVTLNNTTISIEELSNISCYMDRLYPLFSSGKSVKQLIVKGLKVSRSNRTYQEIKDLFQIDSERFERPLTGVGNEIFKAMAAVGFSYNKEVFCFPWLSNKRFESYHNHLKDLLNILADLNKVVIVPVGAE